MKTIKPETFFKKIIKDYKTQYEDYREKQINIFMLGIEKNTYEILEIHKAMMKSGDDIDLLYNNNPLYINLVFSLFYKIKLFLNYLNYDFFYTTNIARSKKIQ